MGQRINGTTLDLRFAFAAAFVALVLGILGNLLAAGLQQKLIGDQFSWETVMAIALAAIGVLVVSVILDTRRHDASRQTSLLDEVLRCAGESPEQMSSVEKLGKYLMYGLKQIRDQSFGIALQVVAILALAIFLAWQLADIAGVAAQSLPLAIFLAWLAMAALPFAIAMFIGQQELAFRKKLQPTQQRGLAIEKLFGSYVSAFIGQILALVILLILDAYMGLWPAFSLMARFIFWLIAGLITTLVCLAGTSVAVTFCKNQVKDGQTLARPRNGTLILALAYPLFVFPVLAVFATYALPILRNPLIGALVLISAVFVLGRQLLSE